MFLDIATDQKVDSKGFMCLPQINIFVLNASNFTKITIPYLKGLILDGIIIS